MMFPKSTSNSHTIAVSLKNPWLTLNFSVSNLNINVTPFNPKDEDFDETGLRSYHLTFLILMKPVFKRSYHLTFQLEELCPKLFVFQEQAHLNQGKIN